MPRKKKKPAASSGPAISIGGNVGGSVAVGNHNIQIGSTGKGSTVVVGGQTATFSPAQQAALERQAAPEEVASLAQDFAALEAQIDSVAAEDTKGEAQQQAEALKEAVAAAEGPDVPAMEKAKTWFIDHLPAVLGGITSVLTHPLVGRLVEAAGEFTLAQFRQRLGLPQG